MKQTNNKSDIDNLKCILVFKSGLIRIGQKRFRNLLNIFLGLRGNYLREFQVWFGTKFNLMCSFFHLNGENLYSDREVDLHLEHKIEMLDPPPSLILEKRKYKAKIN